MTSRSSFFKLLKEDLRQRLWTIVLAAIAFILPVPIYIAMEISSSVGFESGTIYNFAVRLASPMDGQSVWLVLVTCVGALICAVSGFGYLFSKKKVDFFHSLPVKRETLFAVRYINGVLIYLVPYLVMVLVSILIMTFTGNMSVAVFPIVLKGLAIHLAGYLALYTTFILCVTFVGNIVVFFAVSGWTFGITAITLVLYFWFEECFFKTYSYLGDAMEERLHSLRFLCPSYFYIYTVSTYEKTGSMLLQELAFVAVMIVITLFVYRARPSDGAGKAIAFPVMKPVIRVSMELLAGAFVGMLFHEAAGSSNGVPGWMIFGAILGVVLSHMLIQSIFHFDIRKCFAGKWSMGVCGTVAIIFVLVMRYDTFGYDKYIPKSKRIESVAIELSGFDRGRNHYRYDGTYINYTDELSIMELTDMDAVYPYLESLVEDNENYWERWEAGDASSSMCVYVNYRLKNGKNVYREYQVSGIREDLFAPIFESQEYKEVHYSDIYTIPESMVESLTVNHAMNGLNMSLSVAEREEFMTVLRRELSAQALKEKLTTLPVAVMNLKVVNKRLEYDYKGEQMEVSREYYCELPVYSSFTETLSFLAERGFMANADYEWTGKEMMRLEFPEEMYKESGVTAGDGWTESSAEVSEYALKEVKSMYAETQIAYPEEWDYGMNVIPVEPEDYKQVYELCIWEDLLHYGNPEFNRYENYRVSLDVPRAGYNMYETYYFVIPRDADLSFLFD